MDDYEYSNETICAKNEIIGGYLTYTPYHTLLMDYQSLCNGILVNTDT